ncbi:MAG: D-alanyl-D-alanine carboxypeptidase/D-alanyl-D-alanine-endopeptidase [Bacteroidota bacterium]
MSRYKKYSLGLLCYCLLFQLNSQSIQQAGQRLIAHPELASASIGIDVMDLATGESIYAHQPNRALIPASTQKLITTGVALKLLGEATHFTTTLAYDGTLDNGVLTGNLYIVGGGDPCLASPIMEGAKPGEQLMDEWVSAVQKAGIKRIQGSIIADDSYFGTAGIAMGWPWADLGNYYGVGSYGLNWHENFYYLDFIQRPREGERPTVHRTRPLIPGLQLWNEVRTGPAGSGDNAYIYGAPFNYQNYLRGTIPPGSGRFTIKGAIPDPPTFVAQLLTRQLEAVGVSVVLPASSSRSLQQFYSGEGQVLHREDSPSLLAIAERTNLRSVNMYAESLLRQINKHQGLAVHELSSTASLITYLQDELGLDTRGVHLEDGSGLATRNFFPPSFMTAFLRTQAERETFLQTIPLAGKTGSMRRRLKGTAAEGRLYAKSGSVNAVRCYAGYAFPQDGRRLAFSIMVNNYTLSGGDLNRLLLDFMLHLCKSSS